MSENETNNEPAEYVPDPEQVAFDAEVNAAWREIRAYDEKMQAEHPDWPTQPDDPSLKYAQHFFERYLAHRPDDISFMAIQHAFHMWMNVDNGSRHIDAALAQMDGDIDPLNFLAHTVVKAYEWDDREDEVPALTARLLAKLDSDESRSTLLYALARDMMDAGDYEKARDLCQQVIAMNASDHYVQHAKSAIHEMDNLNVGQPAPTFETTDINGNPISLAGLRGKVVLLDFWATWCGPCIGELPHLHRVREKFAGDRFTLLSISLDDDCDAARAMIAEKNMAWQHTCEGDWNNSKIAQLYNVMSIPSTFLIAPDGKIAAKHLRGHDLDKAISELLDSK